MSNVWKAAADRVIVRREKPRQVTETGIVLPEKQRDGRVIIGEVLAYGPDATGVKVGDRAYVITQGAVEIEPGIFSVNADFIGGLVRWEPDA